MAGLAPKSDFLGLEEGTYLYTAGQSPPLKSHEQALRRWVEDKARGPGVGPALQATVSRAKQNAATLLGVDAEDLAILGSSGEASNLICLSVDWQAGDNVVINNVDFPSNIYPWLELQKRGVDVRVARHRDWYLPLEALTELIDNRTRVVIISQVSWYTGQQHDLARLGDVCRTRGARLCADVTHAFGVVPVPASACDFAFSSSYKWILGGTGAAVCFWNRARWPDFTPATVGLHAVRPNPGDLVDAGYTPREDATRLEVGNPPHPSIYLLENGSRYIGDIGQERIQKHVLDLGEQLLSEMEELGLRVITPRDPSERAGNNCFATPNAEAVAAGLREKGVQVVGRDGRVRISPHLFNDEDDVQRCVEALYGLRREGLV